MSASASPRSKLTEEQKEKLNSFIKELEKEGLTPKQRKFCDESCLCRYLRARDWDLQKSYKMLRATLNWREEFKTDQIIFSEIEFESSNAKLYINGKDAIGRPIVYMTPARENSKNYQKNLQLVVYTLERAIDLMPEGIEQMVLIIDFNGYSARNAPPFSVSLETLNILSNHYPERLGAAFLTDTPWIFSLFWKAISPFLNSVTSSKINFANGESEKQKHLAKHNIDLAIIEKRHGGQVAYVYDHAAYTKKCIEDDEKRMRRLGIAKSKPEESAEKLESMMPPATTESAISADDLA